MASSRSRSGFTLIELLVVIAIIAILAAILFPVFAQARGNARKTTCQSNLKQVGLAIQQYVQDYDETFPPYNYLATDPVYGASNKVWWSIVDPYVKAGVGGTLAEVQANGGKGKSVWSCPDFFGAYPAGTTGDQQRSYVANSWVMVRQQPADLAAGIRPVALAAIEYPTQRVLVAESHGRSGGTTGNDTSGSQTPVVSNDASYIEARGRHNGGANYLLVDGHVKWYKAPTPWYAQSNTVAYQHSQTPQAAAWFTE